MGRHNEQFIHGRLGKDPEYKTVGDTGVCTISVAADEHWTDKKGEKQKKTEWFRCNAWGKDADNINKFFKKGDPILIWATTETRSYDNKEGVKQYSREVRIREWSFELGKPGEGKNKDTGRPDDDGPPANSGSTDDIPF